MPISSMHLRNVAIIAHVDHGKTTLVDQLIHHSGMYRKEDLHKLAGGQHGLILDSGDLERERGITITSKNCAVRYVAKDGQVYQINLIDTPGHADFGGEVERVLGMASGILLLVDAYEGPMPQTRFVLQKSLEHHLRPVVVINKVDRLDASPHRVVDEVFDLLIDLDAPDEALDFPVLFASAKQGWATTNLETGNLEIDSHSMAPLLEAIVMHVPPPRDRDRNAPLQMQVTTLDYSDYVGRIAIGRITAGRLRNRQHVTVLDRHGASGQRQVNGLLSFEGLDRVEVDEVVAGDLCAVVGLEPIEIGDTVACPENPAALPTVTVDQPTLHMTFRVNDGPFVGQDGQYITSRQLGERLERELRSNVALVVTPGATRDQFCVSGRGLMHLGILIENMRREGFELCVGKPEVITQVVDGKQHEPIEQLVVECPENREGTVMALMGDRRATVVKIGRRSANSGFVHIEFTIPARSLMGLRSRTLNATQGQAIMHHTFLRYEPSRSILPHRISGVLVANETGQATAYALDSLYDRGIFFVQPGDRVYEGQIVGEHCRAGDLVVNVVRGKKLTNMRAAGKDDHSQVRPIRQMSLEQCLEYIEEDELVEVTPCAVRMRKVLLKEANRRRDARQI